jgi:hypothetical protein
MSAGEKLKKNRWNSCNVVRAGADVTQVWHFDSRANLARQQSVKASEPLPAGVGAKDWRHLFQPRLHVAWIAAEHVFVRVPQLPQADFKETASMVELQLEKLSPMPVGQIAWSIHTLPAQEGMQTVIVMVAARTVVEEFLGSLEGKGFRTDRLEMPLLDQIRATKPEGDGAWIYPEPTGDRAVVAWWYGGVLRNVDLLVVPPENRAETLKEQVLQMAWAGELEGWLTRPPEWHLVAEGEVAQQWEKALRQGLDQPIRVAAPLPQAQLAASTATRAMHADGSNNLLPAEHATRYQSEFVDRLWMRGLGAVMMFYLMCVGVYMIALYYAQFRTTQVEDKVEALSGAYTNAMQLKARFQVLKDRQELKFAALDCWRTTANLLPEGVTLERLNFSGGKKLTLSGTAPMDKVGQVIDFNGTMRKASLNNQSLFDPSKGEELSYRSNPGGGTVSWSFGLELKRSEVQ